MFRKVRHYSVLLQSAPYPTQDYHLDFRMANKDEITDAGETRRCSGTRLDYSTVFQYSAHCSLKILIFKGSRLDNLNLRVPEDLLEEFFGLLISIFNKS